ncbi:50S ribosomal protein L19e [Methanospirillum sp.]|uniref:50S ribosomal protein L19e n=1 Tax=Methanospirillum sp. TaxID=45200 RepID=UPI002983DB3C|nr:50S ribosomal protein L19e [Methanospirillum sp.]
MSQISGQRHLAANVLGCGVNRVWFNPEKITEIEQAISREDIRNLIQDGAIAAHQKRGNSRGRARVKMAKRSYGHCKGPGRRKGAAGSRTNSKDRWIQRIRAQRRVLRELRESGEIDRSVYRKFYRRAAGGQFRTISHMKAQIEIGREQ